MTGINTQFSKPFSDQILKAPFFVIVKNILIIYLNKQYFGTVCLSSISGTGP